jgi:tetratricopeptide (TPR) repeat protein
LLPDEVKPVPQEIDKAVTLNSLAWMLCSCPDPAFRDPTSAVELARKAVKLRSHDGNLWNTLAVALYRAGDWAGASEACLSALVQGNGRDLNNWLVLAMAQYRLGHQEQGLRILVSVAPWIPPNEHATEYLADFRAEAVGLMGEPPTVQMASTPGRPLDPDAYAVLTVLWPDSPTSHALRGYLLAETGHYAEGADALERATALLPDRLSWWRDLGAARLASGDVPGFNRARQGMLGQFGETMSSGMAEVICYAAAAAPLNPGQAELLIRLAERATSGINHYPRARGAIDYRTGQFDAAVEDLTVSQRFLPYRAWDLLFLAMAEHSRGNQAMARNHLQAAVLWIETANKMNGTGGGSRWMYWSEKAEVENLLEEARGLVR